MRETQRQIQLLALRLGPITDADQLELPLEALVTPVTMLLISARVVPARPGDFASSLGRELQDLAFLAPLPPNSCTVMRQRALAALDRQLPGRRASLHTGGISLVS